MYPENPSTSSWRLFHHPDLKHLCWPFVWWIKNDLRFDKGNINMNPDFHTKFALRRSIFERTMLMLIRLWTASTTRFITIGACHDGWKSLMCFQAEKQFIVRVSQKESRHSLPLNFFIFGGGVGIWRKTEEYSNKCFTKCVRHKSWHEITPPTN